MMEDLVFKYNLTLNSIKIILKMKGQSMTATQLMAELDISRRTVDRCLNILVDKELVEISWIQTNNEKLYQLVGAVNI